MSKIPFDEKEMNVAYTVPNLLDPAIPESPAWTYPQSEKDAVKELYTGTPTWCLSGLETGLFAPSAALSLRAAPSIWQTTAVLICSASNGNMFP